MTGRSSAGLTGGGSRALSMNNSYTYDADGLRLTKTVGNEQHKYVWQGSTLVSEYYGGKTLEFFYDESGAPYGFSYKSSSTAAPAMYYYVTNLQGDVTNVLDASGNTVASYTYNAWGKVLSSSGSMASINPLRYRGYYFDNETGLYYVSSRYYSPEIARFINADDIDLLGANSDFASLSLFAYCGNNPVSRVDASGEVWFTAMAVGGVVGAAISAVSSAVTQYALTGTVNWKSVGVSAASGFVSGAIAASPLGKLGQVVAGGVIGGLSYAADCYVNNKAMKLDEAIISVIAGAASGKIGGAGADKDHVLSNAFNGTKKVIERETRRANQKYAQKAISKAISSRNNIFASTVSESAIRFTTGGFFYNTITGKLFNSGLLPNAPTWKPW